MVTVFAGTQEAQVIDGLTYRVLSARKKANVLYLSPRLIYPRLFDADGGVVQGNRRVDREKAFLSRGEDGVLVRIFIPDIAGRADALAWIRAWLAGLRIPID
jgi:hypothetical protein